MPHPFYLFIFQNTIFYMKIAIQQPYYLPSPSYFVKMAQVENFIFLNDVQFEKNDWQHRNRIRNSKDFQWLSVPTFYSFPQKMNEVQIDFGQRWQHDHLHSLEACYGSTKYYKQYIPLFAELFCVPCSTIDRLNMDSVNLLAGILDIKPEIFKTSDYTFKGQGCERLINICKHFRANSYYASNSERPYLNEELFTKAGIEIVYIPDSPPVYAQQWAKTPADFIPNLSTVDLVFNCGPKSRTVLLHDTSDGPPEEKK